jgi:hypothetical protein
MHVNHNAAAAAAASGISVNRPHRGSAKNDFASLIDDGSVSGGPTQVSPRAPVPNPDAPAAVDPGKLVDDALQFIDGTLGDLISNASSISGGAASNSGPVNNGITANIGGGDTSGSGVTNALPSAVTRKHGHHGGHHGGNNAVKVIQPSVPSTPNDGSVASVKTQALSGGTSPTFSLATLLELQESNQNS